MQGTGSGTKFNQLKRLFKKLRGPDGCLWDRSQNHKTLIPYLREETEEFISAVRENNLHHMKEELGDILLQVMFHSQIAGESKVFDIEDVISTLIKKLKRRHPHVFGNVRVKSAGEAIANWKKIKKEDKRGTPND